MPTRVDSALNELTARDTNTPVLRTALALDVAAEGRANAGEAAHINSAECLNDRSTRPEMVAMAGGLLGLIGVPLFVFGDVMGIHAIRPVGVGLLTGAVFCFTIAAGKR